MATTAEVRARIDSDLQLLRDEVAFLPHMAAGWADEPDVNRDVYYLEWRHLMAIRETLDHDYRSGAMTPAQPARYGRLLRQMAAVLPIIQRLGLTPPPVRIEP